MLLKFILPKVMDHVAKVFKLPKVLSYVEQDNELDVQVRDIEKKCTDIGFKVTAIETVIKDLDLEDMQETIKKIKNKRVFKSLNAK